MTRFIVGRACCDISEKMRREMTELLLGSSEKRRIIYIVPDQFEYETEKAVYRALDGRGLTGRSPEVNIRTFSSLSEEILSTLDEKKHPADDIVKNIIMHRVVKENKNALRALGAVADKAGFCRRMVQTVTMLKTAGIPDRELSEENIELRLAELPESEGGRRDIRGYPLITDKLRDVGLLYLAYNARLSEHYLDKLDFTARAAELISSVDVFDGAVVFVDCFNDFTDSQMNFLKNVVTYADDVTIGFAAELSPAAGRESVFATVLNRISRLKERAELEGEAEFVTDGIKERVGSEAVRFLSDHVYGEGESGCAEPPELITARDIHEELDFAAARIRQLTTEGGMRYKDIAVLCAGPEAYGSYVESAFAKYDIPVFCDIPESILHQPPVNLVLALLNALKGFSAETVLSYVKTEFLQREIVGRDGKPRMAGLTKKDIDVFESYIYEWAIGTEALKSEFTFGDKKSAARAEEIRRAVVEPLLALGQRLKDKNGDEMTELLYDFIINEVGMSRAVAARCKNADGTVNAELTSLYQRLWDTLSGIFDSLWHGLKNDRISLAEYARLFRDICAETTLAKPPQYVDTVLVGDIDRTRAGDVKAAFIIGALYDALPSPAAEAGIFSEFETELIRENIFNFDNAHKKEYSLKSAGEQYCLSLYRVYRAVSLPSELLCVSCPETDISGRAVIRSELFGEILRLFKNARVRKSADFGEAFYCRSIKAARQRCAAGIYSDTAEQASLRAALIGAGQGEYVERLSRLRDNRRYGQSRRLKKSTAERLFGTTIPATRIEALNSCRFAYFCEQGLKVRQTAQRSFNSLFRGNAVHYVLQKVLERYRERMEEFFVLDRAALSGLTDYYLTEYRLKESSGNFAGDKRIEYLYNNIAVAACDVLIVIQAEFAARYYRPQLFELGLSEAPEAGLTGGGRFDGELPRAALFSESVTKAEPESDGAPAAPKGSIFVRPLKITVGGREINITGTIDRVDTFTDAAGRNYLRVVDYKTGRRQFSVHNAKHGVNVQMPLYLFALCDANGGAVLPGGVAYTPAKISGAVPSRLSAFNLLSQSYKQSGMYVLDPSTSEEMEHYAGTIAKIIAGGVAEGSEEKLPSPEDILPEPDNRLTAEEYDSFRRECLGTVAKRLEQLYGGDVEPLPLSYKEKENVEGRSVSRSKCACDYCRFKTVCGNVGARENVPDPPKKTKENG